VYGGRLVGLHFIVGTCKSSSPSNNVCLDASSVIRLAYSSGDTTVSHPRDLNPQLKMVGRISFPLRLFPRRKVDLSDCPCPVCWSVVLRMPTGCQITS
jgi:hypothetical protein